MTMTNDKAVLELARAIRPYLPELLADDAEGAVTARSVDGRLAELLGAARSGEPVEDQILDLLRQPSSVHTWAAEFLRRGYPPDIASLIDRGNSGYVGLPGEGEAVRAWKFVCPHGDFVFYRRVVGQTVPPCATHGPLVLAAER